MGRQRPATPPQRGWGPWQAQLQWWGPQPDPTARRLTQTASFKQETRATAGHPAGGGHSPVTHTVPTRV